eukprot:14854867-Alexandrium_andersonii.AAC.1
MAEDISGCRNRSGCSKHNDECNGCCVTHEPEAPVLQHAMHVGERCSAGWAGRDCVGHPGGSAQAGTPSHSQLQLQ